MLLSLGGLFSIYDAMGSICIGVILLVISALVAWRVRSLLVGRSADPDIEKVFNSITIQFGPDTMLASEVPGDRAS